MQLSPKITGAYEAIRTVLATHKTLTVLLLALSVAAGVTGVLQGSVIGAPTITFGGPQAGKDDPLRSCSGMHTMFENFETIAETQEAYVTAMSEVFDEHEKVLRTPSKWKCGPGTTGEPDLPVATSLAGLLSGWHVIPVTDGPAVELPVEFSAFSSLVGELQREYECKLVELQDRSLFEISRNKDLSPGQFCCTELGCMNAASPAAECTGPLVTDSFCNQMCPIVFTTLDISSRLGPYNDAIDTERQRSRTALERSLAALRAADMNYDIARQLVCYQRASLDLRNELSLTADAISCMPKIWDALTSIHDKKQ